MTMRKISLALAGAMIVAFNVPAAFAQEADDTSDMVDFTEIALGLASPEDELLASLPPPDPSAFAALQASENDDAQGASVRIAQGGPGGGYGSEVRPHGGMKGHHGGGGMCSVLSGPLALTDDQYEKLWAIKNETSDAMGPKMLQMHIAKRQMMDAMGQADQDSAKIGKLQSQLASLKSDICMAETGKMVKMSTVLTGDQRKALRMAMIKMSLRHHGKHHHGHH